MGSGPLFRHRFPASEWPELYRSNGKPDLIVSSWPTRIRSRTRDFVFTCLVISTTSLSSGCAPTIHASRDVDAQEEKTAAVYRYSIYERGVTLYLIQLIFPYPAISNHATVVTMINDEAFPWRDSLRAAKVPGALLNRARQADLFGTTPDNEPGKILISVGRHRIKIDYTWEGNVWVCGSGPYGLGAGCIGEDRPVSSFSIEFDARAGHEYRVFAYAPNPEEHRWVWIEDLTSERIVSGEKPPALFHIELPGTELPAGGPTIDR